MILLHFGISHRRALDLIGLSSFMFYYRRKRDDLEALALVRSYADEHPTHGQDRMAKVFHRSHGWNHKKTERLYAKLKLANVRKKRLRRLVQPTEPLLQPLAANECRSMDFMSYSLMDGSKVRILNVIDDYNRQYLGFDIGRSLPAPRVTRALDDFIDFHGSPNAYASTMGLNIPATTCNCGPKNIKLSCSSSNRASQRRTATSSDLIGPTVPKC
jgi:putative transposase